MNFCGATYFLFDFKLTSHFFQGINIHKWPHKVFFGFNNKLCSWPPQRLPTPRPPKTPTTKVIDCMATLFRSLSSSRRLFKQISVLVFFEHSLFYVRITNKMLHGTKFQFPSKPEEKSVTS